ncbi:TPA: MBL fold metallo-hydrolase [Streptococcus suis]
MGSGSKGNAVLIENVLIDCGIPFKKLKPYLYDVDYLLITHIHSDHLNVGCVKQIRKMFPHIKILGNWQVGQVIELDTIINAGYLFKDGLLEVIPFECFHDVLTYGFVWKVDNEVILYATDTNNLENATDLGPFDYLFIESNHDEKKIALAKPTKGYDPKVSALRHMSTQKAKAFYYGHRRDSNSKLIELHKSERFY